MKLLSFVGAALGIVGAFAQQCNRDIECLTSHAQITFIGQILSKDTSNVKNYSATVKPLCNMYGNGGSITQEEFSRGTITIGGFGNHAGGSCEATISNVNDIDIFFVHVNNTVISGGVRTFGLYDPCYGAFKNETNSYVELTKYAVKNNYIPNGISCPVIQKQADGISIDGTTYPNPVSLDETNDSTNVSLDEVPNDASKAIVMTTSAFVILASLLQLLF